MAENKGLRINEQIRVREVRLIDDKGDQKGIVPTIEALKMAKEQELDLVEVAPQANPPVCKILDYSKFKFDYKLTLDPYANKGTFLGYETNAYGETTQKTGTFEIIRD